MNDVLINSSALTSLLSLLWNSLLCIIPESLCFDWLWQVIWPCAARQFIISPLHYRSKWHLILHVCCHFRGLNFCWCLHQRVDVWHTVLLHLVVQHGSMTFKWSSQKIYKLLFVWCHVCTPVFLQLCLLRRIVGYDWKLQNIKNIVKKYLITSKSSALKILLK